MISDDIVENFVDSWFSSSSTTAVSSVEALSDIACVLRCQRRVLEGKQGGGPTLSVSRFSEETVEAGWDIVVEAVG